MWRVVEERCADEVPRGGDYPEVTGGVVRCVGVVGEVLRGCRGRVGCVRRWMEARWDGGARARYPEVVCGWRDSVIVWSRGNAWSGWRLGGSGSSVE